MSNETVIASVTLKSRSGLSVFEHPRKLSIRNIADFRPVPRRIDQIVNLLIEAGFTIEAQTEVGVSFSGPKNLFEHEFKTTLQQRTTVASSHGPRSRQFSYYEASERFLMSRRIELVAEAVQLAIPGIPLHDVNPPIPNPNYYFLHVLTDVPRRLNVTSVHDAGISGAGVRISMVDTGIVTRVTERHVSVDRAHVIVDHTVRSVQGVWLATDAGHFGTNYFSEGVFDNNKITLGTALPDDSMNVEVVYSCLHPHYLAQGYKIDDIRSVANLDVDTDRYGHGTAEAANALAIAPKCTFSFVKAGDEGLEYPLAGFQAALQHQNPKIVTCSWETKTIDNALLLEIANAVANGITVIFAAGNGHTDDPTNPNAFKPVSYPNLISVGGAYPFETGTYAASNYSSSYNSFLYINPQRHCPDVVALVGEKPRGCLIMLPTGPNNFLDQDLSKEPFPNGDNTASDDGWCVCSGTSAAAPQTAGLAALLLERHPDLPPMAIKNILENSSRDIRTGSSATGDKAAPGWDRATGFGLLNGNRAIHYLIPDEFCPFIRDSVQATGEAVTDRLFASPDIIVRNEQLKDPQGELGQTAKHIYDLSDEPEEARDNYIYLRVQNRGARRGDCTATVYYTAAGLFTQPPHLEKHRSFRDARSNAWRISCRRPNRVAAYRRLRKRLLLNRHPQQRRLYHA